MHLKLTGQYTAATLDKLVQFNAPLPYGQRLLVPAIAHFFSLFLPLETYQIFFLLELLINSALFLVLVKLLMEEFKPKQAQLLSWLFILLLPLITVVNYRFNMNGGAAFFYPYDSASLLFLTAGFWLCLRSQWLYYVILLMVATLNRETSLLLVLMIPALHWQNLRAVIKPMFAAALAYLLVRLCVYLLVHHQAGEFFELYFRYPYYTHYEVNLIWLWQEEHIFLFLFCFAGLPLFWFIFFDFIPLQYRPLRYPMLFYFLCLLFFGQLMESRLYMEIAALLYLPVCVAIKNWLQEQKPLPAPKAGLLSSINDYAVLVILAAALLLGKILNPLIVYWGSFYH